MKKSMFGTDLFKLILEGIYSFSLRLYSEADCSIDSIHGQRRSKVLHRMYCELYPVSNCGHECIFHQLAESKTAMELMKSLVPS